MAVGLTVDTRLNRHVTMATNYDKWANFEKELEPDPEDIAREKLRRQKENMSDKEVRRLHDCWEEPEFRRMFEEYQEEVTDPKHRAETEEYLMQCEAEQRAGKQGVRLRPAPPAPAGSVRRADAESPPRARRHPRTSRSIRWTRWTLSVAVEEGCRPRAWQVCRPPRVRRVRSCSSLSRASC